VFVLLLYILQNSCCIVFAFWFWREIVFDVTYILKYDTNVHCVNFLVVAGNSSQNENTF
jgi:hypothetical protein